VLVLVLVLVGADPASWLNQTHFTSRCSMISKM